MNKDKNSLPFAATSLFWKVSSKILQLSDCLPSGWMYLVIDIMIVIRSCRLKHECLLSHCHSGFLILFYMQTLFFLDQFNSKWRDEVQRFSTCPLPYCSCFLSFRNLGGEVVLFYFSIFGLLSLEILSPFIFYNTKPLRPHLCFLLTPILSFAS